MTKRPLKRSSLALNLACALRAIPPVLLLAVGSASATSPEADGRLPHSAADVLAQAAAPSSRDALFGDDLPSRTSKPAPTKRDELFGEDKPPAPAPKPGSRDALFGSDVPAPAKAPSAPQASVKPTGSSSDWRGFVQTEFAYTFSDPEHWSKLRGRLELGRQGRLSENVKYKVSGQIRYDAVFDVEKGFYPAAVERDQRREFDIREAYLDLSAGNWEFRLGRQHIVWGEVPGLFFADVVSARDLREFLLPEFDVLRIPQWAVRAERFAGDSHFELVWIPYPSIDRIGKPGADYFPFVPPPLPAGVGVAFEGEQKPSRSLKNSNFGVRASTLKNGWDLSAFAYRSTDIEANFYRRVINAPGPTVVYSPVHDRITQIGGTVAKDMGDFVLKAEAVYNRGKGFPLLRFPDPTGVARLDFVDYLLGADFSFGDSRLNVYAFQRHFTDYDSDVIPDRTESGLTALLSHKFSSTLEAQALVITSLNRSDWAFRPKLTWTFARNWRMNVGADIMHGPPLGFFGRFAQRDRVYTEIRYSF